MLKTEYETIIPFTTKDGSLIREFMHPVAYGNTRQSLAEAIVSVGMETLSHRHLVTEELYHVTQGTGSMRLGNEQFEIKTGDTICILPGTPHQVRNTGTMDLKILCCCSPPYSHEDTELSSITQVGE